MKRLILTLAATTVLTATAACEQEGHVPDERVGAEGTGPEGKGSPALEAPVSGTEADVGNGASGEIPTEGGGLTEN